MAGLRGAIEAGRLAEFIAIFEAQQGEEGLEPVTRDDKFPEQPGP